MRVGLELSRANKKYKTGTEWYAWHLFQQFKKIATKETVMVYYNAILEPKLSVVPANFQLKRLAWPGTKLWTHLRLGWELFFHPIDRMFFSNAVSFWGRGQVIATIHDLGFFRQPELYHPWERVYQKISHTLAVYRAKKIIAISEATKADIEKYFPWAKAEIKVIYNGWDRDDFKPLAVESKQQICNQYQLPDNFILYIGRLESKKNIQNLIKGYAQLADKSWPLVLAGRPGNFGYEEILELAAAVSNIRFLGYIPQTDYAPLLAAASLFVFPSKFEGFGIPVLEAMGSGVPVACSDLPVLREVAGDSAVFFNPDESRAIAGALQQLINQKDLRQDLVAKGLERAQKFSWEKCAQETWEYIVS